MAVKDILLSIESYPDPTPAEAIQEAAGFAGAVEARLTGLALRVDLNAPTNWLAERLIDFQRMCEAQEAQSRAACDAAISVLHASNAASHVEGEGLITHAPPHMFGEVIARRARTYDLCLTPTSNPIDGQRSIAEAVVFDSGRPAILFRADGHLRSGPGIVVIAWDGSRSAARALAGAIELLPSARQVRVLTVLDDKPDVRTGLAVDVVRHLQAHGVTSTLDEVERGRRHIGEVLETYATDHGADMIVMGAYGHSRTREFILGGATEHMMRGPSVPIFMAH